MKINRIKLQNYRSHSNFEANFTSGINLLVGNNGAGKSSILEAIGITLFGAKPRTTIEECVRFGEKTALIDIEFIGNDGNKYRVEKKIGQSSMVKLFFGNENNSRYNGNDAIKNIKELVGLKDNPDVIYKNIITAEQNKLTEIFQLTDAKRADEFNKIFNTEIYRKIFQNNSKMVLDDYQAKLELKTQEILIHSGNLKDISELESSLKIETDTLQDLKIENEKKKLKISELEIEKVSSESELNIINKLKSEIKTNQSRIEELERLILKLKNDLDSAMKSKEIITLNLPYFEQYQELEKIIKVHNSEIKKLEKQEQEKNKVEKEIASLEKELQTLKSKIESNEKISNLKRVEVDELNKQIIDFQNEKQVITNEINELDYKINLIDKTKTDFNQLFNLRQKKYNDIESLRSFIANKQNLLVNELDLQNQIIKFNEELSTLDLQKNDRIRLETEKEQLNVRNKILTEAKTKLQGSICPYFSQKCKNLDDSLDSDLYFNKMLDEIKNDLKNTNTQLNIYKNVDKDMDNRKTQIQLLNNKILNNKDLVLEIEKYLGNLNLLNEELNTNLMQIELVFQNHKLPLDYNLNDLEFCIRNIHKQFDDFNKMFAEKTTNKKNVEDNITKHSNRITTLQNEIEKYLLENKKNLEVIVNINQNISQSNSKIALLESSIKILPELKASVEEINSKLETIKPQYLLYNKNLENSGKVNSITTELEKENATFTELQVKLNSLQIELSNQDEEKIVFELNRITNEMKYSNEKRTEIASNIATVNGNIEILIKSIKANKELVEKIEVLKKDEKLLNQKISLTQRFRENINSMGTIVAGRMLDEIARKASENYFKISQKPETINWINNQTDKYQVYLTDNSSNVRRKYEMLSGGEQVSVAIAIRTALAQFLTNANFAIFDEPTINLDKDRKELLSRSLNTMLENLEQVLVVTHDDTFKEMAEAIEI